MKKSFLSGVGVLMVTGIILAGCGSTTANNSNPATATAGNKVEEKENQPAQKSQGKFYYTANEGGTISKINVQNNEVVNTIKADGTVHNIQVSPDGKTVAATLVPSMGGHGEDKHTDSGHDMKMNGTALFFDTKTDKLIKEVEVGNHPAHIVYTDDGKYALVSNNEDNNVSVINLQNYTVENKISTGKGPHGFRISSDSQFAYVANMGEDTVSVIDIKEMKEDSKIKVGTAPVTTDITSDGKTLVATLNAENALAIVDIETGKLSKVKVGNGPAQVFLESNDNFAYVANQGTESNPSNSITVVDLKALAAVSNIETGKGSHGVVTSPDNKFVYVTNMFENTVSIIDLKTNSVKETIEVGEVPNGISIMK